MSEFLGVLGGWRVMTGVVYGRGVLVEVEGCGFLDLMLVIRCLV